MKASPLLLGALAAVTFPASLSAQDNDLPEVTPIPNPAPPTVPTNPIPPTGPFGTPGAGPATRPTPPAPLRSEQQLDRTFLLAQNSFTAGRFADSGGTLFSAAALAEGSGDPTDDELADAVATLRVLAFDVASQEVDDPTRFDRAFAATHHALAEDTFLSSKGGWAERRILTASDKLAAASFHLRRSIEWGGRAPSPAGRETLALADQVAVEIAASETVPVPAARVKEAYDRLGAMIPATGETLEEDRDNAGGTDDRVEDAAERAIEGIKNGTRKAAEKVGEKISDFGSFLQGR